MRMASEVTTKWEKIDKTTFLVFYLYCLIDILLKIMTQIYRLITLLSWMSWIVEPDKDIANRGVNKSVSHSWSMIVIHTLFLWNYTNNPSNLSDLKLENSGSNEFWSFNSHNELIFNFLPLLGGVARLQNLWRTEYSLQIRA